MKPSVLPQLRLLHKFPGSIKHLEVNTESDLLLAAGDFPYIFFGKLPDGEEVNSLPISSEIGNSATFMNRPLHVAVTSPDGVVRVYNLSNGCCINQVSRELFASNTSHTAILASRTRDLILVGDRHGSSIELLDLHKGQVLDSRSLGGPTLERFAYSPNGKQVAFTGYDLTMLFSAPWQGLGEKSSISQKDWTFDLQFLDEVHIAVATAAPSIQIWDSMRGVVTQILEGHTDTVNALSYLPDKKWLLSGSSDQSLRFWDLTSASEMWQLTCGSEVTSIVVTPDLFHLYIGTQEGSLLYCDLRPLAKTEIEPIRFRRSVHYTNAKVALVGDSSVGKTGLGLVLSGQEWEPTESTHGRHIRMIHDETVMRDNGQEVTRETLLWDLAGQPGYRVIHQLSLTEVTVALVVFDARSEVDPFAGVRHWDRALQQAQKVSPNAVPLKKFLVAARIDRGGISASKERRERFIEKYGFDGFFETSAKENLNVGELLDAVKAAIAWDALPFVASNELFQNIKAFLLKEKETGRLVCTIDDLYRAFTERGEIPEAYRDDDVQNEFRTCIGLVEGRGLIRRLNFGDLVLLQPEMLDAYAASLINTAKVEPDGLGSIAEEDARAGAFAMPESDRIKGAAQENLLLIAMVEDMLRHEIALREEADLVFPSQFTRSNPDLPDPEGKETVFRFEGPVMNIYATLVVRLAHSGMFTLKSEDMWRNAAIFGAAAGGRFGLALSGEIDEGVGDLALFYQNGSETGLKAQFENFIHAHLRKRSLPGTLSRRRIFICSDCATPVSDIVVQRVRARGKSGMNCPVCGTVVSLVEVEDRVRPAAVAAVAEMEQHADIERDKAAAISVIEGKRVTNAYDVFLCHNGDDKPEVQAIGEKLIERALLPWLDKWELRPGFPWQRALEEQIENIKAAAVFVGPSGFGPWQEMEVEGFLREFVRRKCPVIPVLLPNCPTMPDLPVFLKGMTWVDFRKIEDGPLERLIWGITGERGLR